MIDTHTAVAGAVYDEYKAASGDDTVTVIASTASPYKFARSVVTAIRPGLSGKSDQELIDELRELSGVEIPGAIVEAGSSPVLHDTVVEVSDMEDEVSRWLGL